MDGPSFEREVVRIARMIWGDQYSIGSKIEDYRERDAIIETSDRYIIIEATTSNKKDKTEYDAQKTADLVKRHRQGTKHAVGYLITLQEPTADQREVCKKFQDRIKIMSLSEFKTFLFDSNEYLNARANRPFGSVSDTIPSVGPIMSDKYIEMDFYDTINDQVVSYKTFEKTVDEKRRHAYILLGEYGSGKSMSLRQVYKAMEQKYRTSKAGALCPIYLNLREHLGQKTTAEAMDRHASEIAYGKSKTDLIKFWRTGGAFLILDGFDELSTLGWGLNHKKVREHRRRAMELIRNFVTEIPHNAAILIAGRQNYFDSTKEMLEVFGLSENNSSVLTTLELDENQVAELMKSYKITSPIPTWIPRRPLILSYLMGKEVGIGDLAVSNLTPATGWNQLLNVISERESTQDSRLEPTSVRLILERLATLARGSEGSLGRISVLTIQETFQEIVGIPPDDAAQHLLLRLPGLGVTSGEDGSRSFVEFDLADACAAGDVQRFIQDPYTKDSRHFSKVIEPIGPIATAMIAEALESETFKQRQLELAISNANELSLKDNAGIGQLSMDLAAVICSASTENVENPIYISGGAFDDLEIVTSTDLRHIWFKDCIFRTVSIDSDSDWQRLPHFDSCIIEQLIGVAQSSQIPKSLQNCDIAQIHAAGETSAKILELDLPLPVRVTLTCLKKLFLQSGQGRQESAFYRGALDAKAQKLIPLVLSNIQKHGFAHPVKIRKNEVWQPERSKQARVRRMLSRPDVSADQLLQDAMAL